MTDDNGQSQRKHDGGAEMDEPCADYNAVSPQNPAFGWCGRYAVHLDGGGRFCRLCRTDDAFRRRLSMQAAVRHAPSCQHGLSYCETFGISADAEQCAACQRDPLFRAMLAGQAAARKGTRPPCAYRGETLREEERGCCNGRRSRVTVFICAQRGEANDGMCAACGAYRIADASDAAREGAALPPDTAAKRITE